MLTFLLSSIRARLRQQQLRPFVVGYVIIVAETAEYSLGFNGVDRQPQNAAYGAELLKADQAVAVVHLPAIENKNASVMKVSVICVAVKAFLFKPF